MIGMFKTLRSTAAVAAVLFAAACAQTPVSPAGTVTLSTATLTSPANNAAIPNLSQPVTLTVTNAFTASSEPVTYTFEVSTDVGFATKVLTQDMAQTSGATTSLKLSTLPAGATYYWRTKTSSGGTASVFTAPLKFVIGPAITVSAPTPTTPLTGTSSLSQRPTFTVTNSATVGPVTVIVYRFELSTSSTFASIAQSASVTETAVRTSWTPTADLAGGTTYYWRVQATDQGSSITSGYSTAQSISTQVVIDLTKVNYQRFVNISGWPITDTIRAVEQDGNYPGPMCIDHTKRGVWPTSDFFGDPGTQVESNQWYFAFIGNTWYGGSGENMRPNQICKQGQMSEAIGPDGTWGGPMDTWAPRKGDLVGFMMTTPARFWPDMKTLDERSNMVVQPWVDTRAGAIAIKK